MGVGAWVSIVTIGLAGLILVKRQPTRTTVYKAPSLPPERDTGSSVGDIKRGSFTTINCVFQGYDRVASGKGKERR